MDLRKRARNWRRAYDKSHERCDSEKQDARENQLTHAVTNQRTWLQLRCRTHESISERETIAPEAPHAPFTQNPAMQLMVVSLRLDHGPCGPLAYDGGRVLRLLITAVMLYRRPVWTDWKRRRCELRKFSRRINDFAADHRQHRFECLDFFVRNRKIIIREYGKVS